MFLFGPDVPTTFRYFAMMVCVMFVGIVLIWIANLIKLRKSGTKTPTTRAKASRIDMTASDVAHHHAIQTHQQAVIAQQAEVNRQVIQGTTNAAQPPAPQSPTFNRQP